MFSHHLLNGSLFHTDTDQGPLIMLTSSAMACYLPTTARSCVLIGLLMLIEEDVPELETMLFTYQGP